MIDRPGAPSAHGPGANAPRLTHRTHLSFPLLHPPTPLHSVTADRLNADLKKIDAVKKLGEQAGFEPVYIVGGASLFAILVMYFLFGAGLLCNLVGFAYPTYASIKALETPETDDDKQWLTYWVLYAGFSIIEHFTDPVLYWIPFYFSIKLGLLLWMMLPGQRGATYIYGAIRSRVAAAPSSATASGQASSDATGAAAGVYNNAE
jgi:receptor expression-enhancing protein 5/6